MAHVMKKFRGRICLNVSLLISSLFLSPLPILTHIIAFLFVICICPGTPFKTWRYLRSFVMDSYCP